MGQAFTPRQLDAEQAANLNDSDAYALSRCRQEDLGERLAAASLRAEAVGSRIRALSGGNFLYTVRVLNELASGSLPECGPEALPADGEGGLCDCAGAAEGVDWTLRLDHFSPVQWLSERNARGRWRAGAYALEREATAGRFRASGPWWRWKRVAPSAGPTRCASSSAI